MAQKTLKAYKLCAPFPEASLALSSQSQLQDTNWTESLHCRDNSSGYIDHSGFLAE
jgi:hypothetical protein